MDKASWLGSWPARLTLAVVFGGLGAWVLTRASNGFSDVPLLLFGMLLILLGAVSVATPIAAHCANFFVGFLLPGERFDGKQPMYSIPESKRKNGFNQEAFDGFKEISEEHPQELKAYIQMIDVAIVDLKDEELAQTSYELGQETLREPAARQALSNMYDGIRTRITSPYDEAPKAISLRKGE